MLRFCGLLSALTLLWIPAVRAADAPVVVAKNPTISTTLAGGGKLIHGPAPVYPEGAIYAQVSGRVKIEAWIGKDGKVVAAQVTDGPNLLRKAARDAVMHWRYGPTIVEGEDIDRIARIEFNFQPLVQ